MAGTKKTGHGTVTRWRSGCRCAACRHAHNTETRDLRRQWQEINQTTWHAILRKIRMGTPLAEAAERHGLTPQHIYGQSSVLPEREGQLDTALRHGRDPSLPHGKPKAYRAGCRCPECRAWKRTDR